MTIRIVVAIIIVLIVWTILNFLVHGVILGPVYEETANLWRAEEDMKVGVMNLANALSATFFVLLYALLIRPRSLSSGLKFGILYGLAVGIPMGYGTFSVMPIPYSMALTWFLGSLVNAILGGLIVSFIIRDRSAAPVMESESAAS